MRALLLALVAWLVHLWRSFTAVTLYRHVRAELDEVDDAPEPMAGGDAGDEPDAPPAAAPGRKPKLDKSVQFQVRAAAPPPPAPLEPITIDANGWLHGARVVHVPTKRKGYRFRGARGKVTDRPSGLIVHWTATPHGTALAMVRRTAKIDPTGEENGWVHLWIEHDGTIYQSGSLHVGAPHAGARSSARIDLVGGAPAIVSRKESALSPNFFFDGVETVCVGEVRRMRKVGGKYVKAAIGEPGSVWLSWPYGKPDAKGKPRGHVVPDDQVVDGRDRHGVHRYWQAFTPRQLEAHERILEALLVTYGWPESAVSWDHADVDPTRKSDSGLWKTRWLPGILARIRARRAAAEA